MRQLAPPADRTSSSSANTSTAPVGRFGVDGLRRAAPSPAPSTRITHSDRSVSADVKAGESGSATHLGQAVVVAQIDEQQAAMVAHAVDPAGKTHGLADIGGSQMRRRCGVR